MAEKVEISVRSNISALSSEVLHEAFATLVDSSMKGAEQYLRADRASHTRHSQGGATVDHIHRDSTSITDLIESHLGITPVLEKDERHTSGRYRHSQAPLFAEGGTRSPIFSSRPGGLMENRSEGIFGRRSVRGQRAQRFMLKTYVMADALIRSNPAVEIALQTMAAVAAAEELLIDR